MPEEIVVPPPMTEEEELEYNENEIPFCTLKPLSLPGERAMQEEVYEEESEVLLDRRNTVPHDVTIDEELQACLFFSDGHWFIEDRSRDNSTYVHAGAGIKLEPGDIIRMGERKFEFNIKTRKK
ncbi:FHA domain-containing protein [Parabacteroides pacaensis]|uniref:FHA domain-containing protein n=1 Tax=Parabacteroides pacaensis TaxID=2086575 RepID=UPI00131B9A2A|nr:FHA domain-containing protein [Parabacteroides pacaensis]